MRKMSWKRRGVCALMALVMVLGMVPVSIFAEDYGTATGTFENTGSSTTEHLFFATDRHTNTSIIGNLINAMESDIGENELDYLGLGGDMVGSGNDHPPYNSSTVLGEITGATTSLSATNVDIVAGIHDMNVTDDSGIVLPYSGGGKQIYEGTHYYVYGVPESCISGAVTGVDPATEAQKFEEWAKGVDSSKVIIVLSHYPLHQRRNDNTGASYWAAALNSVAVGDDTTIDRDVIFFWGHNHTGESNADTAVYHVAPKGTISVQGGSSSQTIYFTYANAGYLNAKSSATLLTITDTQVKFEKYVNSSVSTTNTVTRVVKAPQTLEVTGKTTYTTGQPIEDPQSVVVKYTDGTEETVTTGWELASISPAEGVDSDNKFLAAGTYNLTYTCTVGTYKAQAVLSVTVKAAGEKALSSISAEGTKIYEKGATFVPPVITAHYTDGTTATVTATVAGTVDTGTVGTYTLTYSYTEGDVTKTTTFTVTVTEKVEIPEPTIAENVTGSSNTTTTKTVYVLVSKPTAGNQYIIVNRGTAGDGYALKENTTTGSAIVVNEASGKITAPYIETSDKTIMWNAESGLTFQSENGAYYLTYSGSKGSYSLEFDKDSGEDWASDENKLYREGKKDDYYLRCNGTTWTMGGKNTKYSVYFYEKQTIEIESTTSTTGTYSIAGNPAEFTQKVVSGDTAKLGSVLTFTPESGTATTTDTSTSATYTIYSDPSGIFSGISGNTATFTGNTGVAVVKVSYTGNVGSESYYVDNYIKITAEKRDYKLSIQVTDGDTTKDPGSSLSVKQGSTLDLSNTAITYVDGNGVTQTVDNNAITWSITGTTDATVSNGTVTIPDNTAGQKFTVTATWNDPYGNTLTDTLEVDVVDAIWSLDLAEPIYTAVTDTSDTSKTYFIKQTDGSYIAVTDTTDTTQTYYTQSTTSITKPIIVKDVEPDQTYTNVWAVITKDGVDIGKLTDEQLAKLTFISSNESIATVNQTTGVVTFTGKSGTVSITAIYKYTDGKSVTDTVIISVSDDHYYVPEDGTDDFPEYPNEGAIRFDKTATAVGNFSQTGIVQVELSMTGVPYTTGNEMDVVVMLDMTGSMSDNGMEAAEEATKAFVKMIVQNEDKTYNDNRIAVYAFNSGDSSPYELVALSTIDSDEELETANTAIDTASDKQASGGTPFDEAAKQCYDVLQAAKTTNLPEGVTSEDDYDRQQFCVFMSDGGPTAYYGSDKKTYYGGNNTSGDALLTSCMTGYSSSTSSDWEFTLPTEYYTDAMKADDVTVYSVGLLLQDAPSNPAPYSSMTDSTYDATTDSLTTIGSHYYFTSSILKQMASDESKYIDIFSVDKVDNAVSKFEAIAKEILDAAKDVKVEDKMADEFSMVFEAPNATVAGELPNGQEFYIEVKDYALNAVTVNGVITDYTRGTATSLMKLYLGKSGSTYYAASDSTGTKYADPVFSQTALGTKYYWTTVNNAGKEGYSGVSVTVSGTTYYFDKLGKSNEDSDWSTVSANWYNLTSGAYATGTKITEPIYVKVDDTSDANKTYYEKNGDGTFSVVASPVEGGTYYIQEESSTSQDLIIATPYFVYNAATKLLVWTAEKLSSSELALSYFLYLDESAGYENMSAYVQPGTYDTNEYANLTYNNFQNTECEQVMPVPQVTWNGAKVSYVFYLVNEQGQPVNRAGRVVPFSEAVYVTDLFTEAVLWNDFEELAELDANYLANEIVPSVYELYDKAASYTIHVFEDENGDNLNNHFVIGGTTGTTYVFNTKADATKYTAAGTYAASKSYYCKDYNVTGTEGNYDYKGSGTQYKDSNGKPVYDIDSEGKVYTIVQKTDATAVETGFDFGNTTVAFAVIWKPQLETDTVVVDFGLDVVIDVTINDAIAGGVVGVRTDAPSGVLIGSGTYNADKRMVADLTIDGMKIGTATVESLTSVRFSFDRTNGMKFTKPITFYYESEVNFYDSNNVFQTTSMYSSVTIIPAATIYYEEEFLTLNAHGTNDPQWKPTTDSDIPSVEDGDSTTVTTQNSLRVQATDRPGVNNITAAYDANNLYGFDKAYEKDIFYSLGQAHKVTVGNGQYATAEFTFTGTGFDIIALTSNKTGVMVAQVFDSEGTEVRTIFVDTYWGYKFENGVWTVTTGQDPTDLYLYLYQIPIITATGLTYGEYRVVLTASYNQYFDHPKDGGYDLYLDAVRIYDPAGVVSGATNKTISDAYEADGEMIPAYHELRDNVIEAEKSGSINGVVFIDGIPETSQVSQYKVTGPNNELYLAPGQAVLFNLAKPASIEALHIGLSSVSGDVEFYIFNANAISSSVDVTNQTKQTLTTATDMYYDITDIKDGTILIYNSGSSGILSVTTLKVVADPAPTENVIGIVSEDTLNNLLLALGGAVMDDPDTNPDQDNPGTDEPGTDVPGTDEPGTDVPGTDEPGTDDPGTDDPGTDNPGTDEPSIDEPTDSTKPGATTPNGGTTDGDSGKTNKTVLIVAIAGGAVLLLASIIVLLKKLLGGR